MNGPGVRIPLPCGRFALVDEADADRVSKHSWRSWNPHRNTVYAVAYVGGRTAKLHQFILGEAHGRVIDHIDGDGLNNRRSNLRFATVAQNAHNSRPRAGSSKYKGVWWHKFHQRWRASITHNYKKITIGHFTSEEDAARAYDAKALELFGAFARLNFPNTAEVAG